MGHYRITLREGSINNADALFIFMAETQDTPRSDDSGSIDPLSQLRNDYKNLSNNAQQLLTEKLYLENECTRLKKRVNSLDEEVRSLRKPPFVVGHVQDRVDDKAVVRCSKGTVFLLTVIPALSKAASASFPVISWGRRSTSNR